MKLTVVGTACTWFKRNNTSFIIDDNIVLDTPEGSYKDIAKYTDIYNLKAVFITHFHGDHFLDIHVIATLIMRRGTKHGEKLKIYAPKGIAKKITKLNKFLNGAKDETMIKSYLPNIEFIEIKVGKVYSVGKYKVKAYKMDHGGLETYGYSFIEDSGKVISFSADTKYCKSLQEMVSNSNVAFVDFASLKYHHAHMNKEDFHKLLNDNPKTKIYPVHTCDDSQDYVEKNKLNPLYDGQVLKI